MSPERKESCLSRMLWGDGKTGSEPEKKPSFREAALALNSGSVIRSKKKREQQEGEGPAAHLHSSITSGLAKSKISSKGREWSERGSGACHEGTPLTPKASINKYNRGRKPAVAMHQKKQGDDIKRMVILTFPGGPEKRREGARGRTGERSVFMRRDHKERETNRYPMVSG